MGQTSVQQVNEFCVVLGNTPGALSKLAGTLAKDGVNIEGLASLSDGPAPTMRLCFVTNQEAEAKAALSEVGMEYTEKTILALHNPDKPGVIAKVASMLGDAGVNIDNIYFSTPGAMQDTIVYIDAGDGLDKAAELLHGLEH